MASIGDLPGAIAALIERRVVDNQSLPSEKARERLRQDVARCLPPVVRQLDHLRLLTTAMTSKMGGAGSRELLEREIERKLSMKIISSWPRFERFIEGIVSRTCAPESDRFPHEFREAISEYYLGSFLATISALFDMVDTKDVGDTSSRALSLHQEIVQLANRHGFFGNSSEDNVPKRGHLARFGSSRLEPAKPTSPMSWFIPIVDDDSARTALARPSQSDRLAMVGSHHEDSDRKQQYSATLIAPRPSSRCRPSPSPLFGASGRPIPAPDRADPHAATITTPTRSPSPISSFAEGVPRMASSLSNRPDAFHATTADVETRTRHPSCDASTTIDSFRLSETSIVTDSARHRSLTPPTEKCSELRSESIDFDKNQHTSPRPSASLRSRIEGLQKIRLESAAVAENSRRQSATSSLVSSGGAPNIPDGHRASSSSSVESDQALKSAELATTVTDDSNRFKSVEADARSELLASASPVHTKKSSLKPRSPTSAIQQDDTPASYERLSECLESLEQEVLGARQRGIGFAERLRAAQAAVTAVAGADDDPAATTSSALVAIETESTALLSELDRFQDQGRTMVRSFQALGQNLVQFQAGADQISTLRGVLAQTRCQLAIDQERSTRAEQHLRELRQQAQVDGLVIQFDRMESSAQQLGAQANLLQLFLEEARHQLEALEASSREAIRIEADIAEAIGRRDDVTSAYKQTCRELDRLRTRLMTMMTSGAPVDASTQYSCDDLIRETSSGGSPVVLSKQPPIPLPSSCELSGNGP